jgi:anti-sigma regulatory factor (Ser/Thr protein kinase)
MLVGIAARAPGATARESPGEWPVLLHLEHDRRSVTYARRWVLRQAAAAGIRGEAQAVVELLTSELVANAIHHGPADGHISVETGVVDGHLHVTVTDQGAGSPVVRDPPADATGGRGMMLVEMLAVSWGTTPLPDGGKAVWFSVVV